MKSLKSYFSLSSRNGQVDGTGDGPQTKRAKISSDSSIINDELKEQINPSIVNEITSTSEIVSIEAKETISAPSVACEVAAWPPFASLDESWRNRLLSETKLVYFQRLIDFVEREYQSNVIFPPKNQVFTALNLCPFDRVKVVVIGQDPYHGPGQAHGLAFSVLQGIPPPPSLKNMITEAVQDVKISPPQHGNLHYWSEQGVLLLNAVLTVRQGQANSHQNKGWEDFTDAVVRELRKKDNIVYLLWGKPAQKKCSGINQKKNIIITSSHPSPLSAYKTSEPFIGSKMFSRCNAALASFGMEPIDWNIR